jgi:hypothetical protein
MGEINLDGELRSVDQHLDVFHCFAPVLWGATAPFLSMPQARPI